jgi:hypothetical protein
MSGGSRGSRGDGSCKERVRKDANFQRRRGRRSQCRVIASDGISLLLFFVKHSSESSSSSTSFDHTLLLYNQLLPTSGLGLVKVKGSSSMTLFEVPGWDIPAQPTNSDHHNPSRKRRRITQDHDDDKLNSATANVEALMKQLEASSTATSPLSTVSSAKKQKIKQSKRPKSDSPSRTIPVSPASTSYVLVAKPDDFWLAGSEGEHFIFA